MGWPLWWVLQGLVVLQAGYTLGLGQERVGVTYALGVLPMLPLHCLPYSTRGGFFLSSPMDKQ